MTALALQADEGVRSDSDRDAFFQLSPEMLCVLGPQLEMLDANTAWAKSFGATCVGEKLSTLIHPDDAPKATAAWNRLRQNPDAASFSCRCRMHDRSWRELTFSAIADPKRRRFYAVARDVTDQRSTAAAAAQSQKLGAVGSLAAGVAHEINTPIQFVGDNLAFVTESFEQLNEVLKMCHRFAHQHHVTQAELEQLTVACDEADLRYLQTEVPRSLGEAREGVRRVAELVRALKEFAHPDTADMAASDINNTVTRALTLARNELKYAANVQTDFGQLPMVECHDGQLNQVLINLLVNAGHAIADKRKQLGLDPMHMGTVRVTTRVDGEMVVIAISDDGNGIPPEVQERMFEPFFTTKEVGRGTGQGLAIARKVVVDQHHGSLDFKTSLGVGTTFFVRLPTSQPKEQ